METGTVLRLLVDNVRNDVMNGMLNNNFSDFRGLYDLYSNSNYIKNGVQGWEVSGKIGRRHNTTVMNWIADDDLNVEISDSRENWKAYPTNIGGNLTYANDTVDANTGDKVSVGNFIEQETEILMESILNEINRQLAGASDEPRVIAGLQHLIQANGMGTVQSLDSSHLALWRNKFLNVPNTNDKVDNGIPEVEAFTRNLHQIKRDTKRSGKGGGRGKGAIVLSEEAFGLMQYNTETLTRFTEKRKAQVSKDGFMHGDDEVIYETNLPDGYYAYLISPKAIGVLFFTNKQGDKKKQMFSVTGPMDLPANDVQTIRYKTRMQHVAFNRNDLGVLTFGS